jgi:hypothetical protein
MQQPDWLAAVRDEMTENEAEKDAVQLKRGKQGEVEEGQHWQEKLKEVPRGLAATIPRELARMIIRPLERDLKVTAHVDCHRGLVSWIHGDWRYYYRLTTDEIARLHSTYLWGKAKSRKRVEFSMHCAAKERIKPIRIEEGPQ